MLTSSGELQGRATWKLFTTVCILKEQHRFSDATPDGKKLYDMVKKIWSDEGLSMKEVEDICTSLNEECVISEEDMGELLKRNPR